MYRVLTVLLTLMLWCPVLAHSARTTIDVQKRALVKGSQITLGDVAVIRGNSASLNAKVRGIIIGQAPPAGEERVLNGGYILTRLKHHGVDVDHLQVNVPDKLHITRASQRIEARDLEATVVAAIHAKMPWEPRQVTIHTLRGIEPLVLPQGAVDTDVTFPLNTDFLGPTSFTVFYRVEGNLETRVFGSANIEVTQSVITTARPIGRHETLQADDLRVTEVNLARLPRRVLMQPEEVIGKRTKRALQAHALIHAYDVETLPLVRKGDAVLILVESPLLKVSTVGEALEQGQRGETIRVRNIASQREIRAVVVDRKTVKVPF